MRSYNLEPIIKEEKGFKLCLKLHKKFEDYQVKELICRYLTKEIERNYIQEILGIGKTRFFALVKKYNENPDNFSIEYKRGNATRKISKDIEDNIMKELTIEKQLITDPEVPCLFTIRRYQHLQLSTELKEVDFIWPDLKEKLMTGKF